MSISIEALKALAAAGATAEMIIAAVEAHQAAQMAAEIAAALERRRRDRDRQRQRRSKLSRGQGVTPRDIADALPAVASAASSDDQPVVPNGQGCHIKEADQKERSPTPPKEKLLSITPQGVLFEDPIEVVVARARRNERATRLPDGWSPTLLDLAEARKLLTDAQVSREIEKFRDYWHARAGPGAVKRNWSATWRNWCRKEAENVERNNQRWGGGAGGPAERETFASYALKRARARAGDGTST